MSLFENIRQSLKNFNDAGDLGKEIGQQLLASGLPSDHWDEEKLAEVAADNDIDLSDGDALEHCQYEIENAYKTTWQKLNPFW